MQITEKNSFIKLVIKFNPLISIDLKNIIDRVMLEQLDCDGIEELSLSEQELNQLLGKEAVTGGPLPQKVLESLEKYAENRAEKSCTYYFYGDQCFDVSENAKDYLIQNYGTDEIEAITINKCQEESWLEKWKEHYHPIEITKDFLVLPSWTDITPYENKKIMRIDPGQAFGTGSHESTKLCLGLIFKHFHQNQSLDVLDFGCGSGILALSHLLLNNQATTYLFDIDPAAYENIEVNRILNKLDKEKTILIPAGEELSAPWNQQQYELVMANILLPILLAKAELLSNLVKQEGFLLISGIMNDQWEELNQELSKFGNWQLVDQSEQNSWMAVLIKKINS